MTWLNPVAFAGLVALAIPILVHLFGRRVARRQRFPTLRLLLATRATPATRSRPSDLLLLILRCGVLLAAVSGLAQPRWLSRTRDSAVPVRLILVDTSASLSRLTSDGGVAVDRARALARRMLDSAGEGVIVETADPGANVAGAASWLTGRAGRRELVIVSDFQVGALSDGQLASLPDGIGLSLRRIDVTPLAGPGVKDSQTVRLDSVGVTTRASWRVDTALSVLPLTLSIAQSDSAGAKAMLAAARAMVPGRASPASGATVVFPGSPSSATPTVAFSSPRQGDLLVMIRANQLLKDAARSAIISSGCAPAGVVVARNRDGQVVASLEPVDSGVVIHSCAAAGSVAGSALLAATAIALTPEPAFEELEPNRVPDEVLRTWERPPTAFAPRGREETSPDGRWFWLTAIGLLLLEQIVRRGWRTRVTSADGGVGRERAA